MKYTDIRDTITEILNNAFGYTVYTETVDVNVQKPCFIVQLIPLQTTNLTYYQNRLINVDITFLSQNKTIEECLTVQDKLETIFDLYICILNRSLKINGLTFNTTSTDNILHCIFTLDYLEEGEKVVMTLDGTNTISISKLEADRLKALGYTELKTMKNIKIKEVL